MEVPSGITLTTLGGLASNSYGRMARIIRSSNKSFAMVVLDPGSVLQGVWIDGNRINVGLCETGPIGCHTVLIHGGDGTRTDTNVRYNRISDPDGASGLNSLASDDFAPYDKPCNPENIEGNLITAYADSHHETPVTDGMSITCGSAFIAGNQVVDATDVGIILYQANFGSQNSIVTGNSILNAGNSASGAIEADPLFSPEPLVDQTTSSCAADPSSMKLAFGNTIIQYNRIWTGPDAHMAFGFSLGTREYFMQNDLQASFTGTGTSLLFNNTGEASANVNDGIVVSGMCNARIAGNALNFNIAQHNGCQTGELVAQPGYAEGLQSDIPVSTSDNISACFDGTLDP